MELRPVSLELHHEITQFLYSEARMLDREGLREWVDTIVDPQINYQTVVTDERFRKDNSPAEQREVYVFDDDHEALNMRVRQYESGLQTMNDPGQRMLRLVGNIQAFHDDDDDRFIVLSYGILSRSRRLYENEQTAYRRKDILKKTENGSFRLLNRRIDLCERVVRNKNLLFFL